MRIRVKTNKLNKYARKNKAITLIALIITIIILLILAGVTIRLIIGNEGLIGKAQKTGEAYLEQEAREKLEIALADLRIDKYRDSSYNSEEYIDKKLEKQEMIVIGDIVIVNDWKFEIDRSVPKIGNSLGKGTQNEEIKISAEAKIREDYVNANILGNIAYDGVISEIIINGETIEVPEKVDGTYAINKEITENGIYTIYAKDENGNYKIAKVEVTDITEDMDIWNRQDMENFRDKVNAGRTFEGRTARVMADIDLQGSEENKWVAIGTDTISFKGTFEGNYHKINNLYINDNKVFLGFFRTTSQETKIRNIIFDNVSITNVGNVIGTGSICGANYGVIENCGVRSGSIVTKKNLNNSENDYTGGISGLSYNCIKNCYNLIDIVDSVTINNFWSTVGGICGANLNGTIEKCYNKGKIKSMHENGAGIIATGGISGFARNTVIKSCYNNGDISYANGADIIQIGGIVGRNGDHLGTSNIENSYFLNTKTNILANTWNGTTYNTITQNGKSENDMKNESFILELGDAFMQDVKNEDGTWKYNNGYPILKWQVNK